jgi:hypothetical protein
VRSLNYTGNKRGRTHSRNAGTDNPKHPHDKKADEFCAEGGDKVILYSLVDGVNAG